MQVLHSRVASGGEESFADHQSELGNLGCHQSHDEQGEQDGTQREKRVMQQQLRFREALLLKQGHRVGKVLLLGFLIKWYPNQGGNPLKQMTK